MYLLDTNICIYGLKGTYPALNNKLLTIHPDEIAVSSITLAELEYGAEKSKWSVQNRQRMQSFLVNYNIIPFTENDSLAFGRIRANLESNGTPIGAYDMMIASQSVARNLIVITHNVKEFNRVPGIVIEDWTEE